MWISYCLSTVSTAFMFRKVSNDLSIEMKITILIFFVNFGMIFYAMSITICVLICIYDVAKSLNEVLQKSVANPTNEKLSRTVTKISRIFVKVCSLCQQFSGCFRFVNVVISLLCFSYFGLENYCVFSLLKNPNLESVNVFVLASLWTFTFTIQFLPLILYSELINREGRRTGNIICEISPLCCSKSASKRISAFIHQLSHLSYGISSGTFKLDMSFLFDYFVSIFSISLVFFQLYGMNR